MKMPNISHTAQQKGQCIFWMAEDLAPGDNQKKVFKYQKSAPARSTVDDLYQSYVKCRSPAHRGENGRPVISNTKKPRLKRCQNQSQTVNTRCGSHC